MLVINLHELLRQSPRGGEGGSLEASKISMESDPWEYSVVICLLWTCLLILALLDTFFHRTVPMRKFPLYIIILIGLFSEIIQHGVSFILSFKFEADCPSPSLAGLYYMFLVSDALNETFELCLIMLIASGWGVIFTRLKPVHRCIIIGGTIFLGCFQFMINFTDKGTPFFGYWVTMVILFLFSIWFYVLNMIHSNHDFLRHLSRYRTISMSSFGDDSSSNPGAAPLPPASSPLPRFPSLRESSRSLQSQLFLASPTYLKSKLYRIFAYFVVFYILTQILSNAILTALIILMHDFTATHFWLFTIPRDLLELLLYGCLCYLFRLREDNPYFPIPDRDPGSAQFASPMEDFPPRSVTPPEEGAIAL